MFSLLESALVTRYLQFCYLSFNPSASVGNLSASCNAACNCDVKFFSPICSQDDLLTFYSPCFAGCTAHVLGDKVSLRLSDKH